MSTLQSNGSFNCVGCGLLTVDLIKASTRRSSMRRNLKQVYSVIEPNIVLHFVYPSMLAPPSPQSPQKTPHRHKHRNPNAREDVELIGADATGDVARG